MRPQPIRLLEIGTGSGGIAHYFANHPSIQIEVHGVDVVDNRQIREGFTFSLVEGTTLPFPNQAFDVVLSNHVIEHVGALDCQHHHLREIRRVLRQDGIGYLAVPNRWMLVEPHYTLAFLSWLPHDWRSKYLKWRRGVAFYDCEPLTLPQAHHLFQESGLDYENIGVAALRAMLALEYPPNSLLNRVFSRIPDSLIRTFGFLLPTLIFRIRTASTIFHSEAPPS